MHLVPALLTIGGLIIFEIISSIDNAVVNAEVLETMSAKGRRWFLLWGLIFAVFVVRGFLPWLIIWIANPSLGALGSLFAAFSNDPKVFESVENSAPILLTGGGTFLIFLFFNWLFMERKNYGLLGETFFETHGIWFYAVVSILLSGIVWFALEINPLMAFGAVIGSTAFFITHGFKQNAEESEKKLLSGGISDFSKILYLEIIDATFSIDGVLGAFAFTLSVPLIILGNGIGAMVLRKLTISNIEKVKKYLFLKNGAMYSIFFLGVIMLLQAFGADIPEWLSPAVTIVTITYFFLKSKQYVSYNNLNSNIQGGVASFEANIKGRVQGVGFRYLAYKNAMRLCVSGSAKNLPDGSVEIFAFGHKKNLEAFAKLLKEGPILGKVKHISIKWGRKKSQSSEFVLM